MSEFEDLREFQYKLKEADKDSKMLFTLCLPLKRAILFSHSDFFFKVVSSS